MTIPTKAQFLDRYPEFFQQPAAVIDGCLAEATSVTPELVWGDFQYEGICNLAAHKLALRIVQLGQQLDTVSGNPYGEGYKATLYGQQYQRLLDGLPLTGFAV